MARFLILLGATLLLAGLLWPWLSKLGLGKIAGNGLIASVNLARLSTKRGRFTDRFGSDRTLGRLPGDIVIERESVTIFIPLGSSLAVSLVLTLVLWLLGR
jgi:hypothetical protein